MFGPSQAKRRGLESSGLSFPHAIGGLPHPASHIVSAGFSRVRGDRGQIIQALVELDVLV